MSSAVDNEYLQYAQIIQGVLIFLASCTAVLSTRRTLLGLECVPFTNARNSLLNEVKSANLSTAS